MQTVFFDVYTATEQLCEEVNFSTEWVEYLDTLDEVTEANFLAWVKTNGENVLDMHWALKQLRNVLTQKVTGQVNKFTQAEMGKEAPSHNLETGADSRRGSDPESKTTAFGRCVIPKKANSWSCCQLGKRRFVSWRSSVSPHSATIRRFDVSVQQNSVLTQSRRTPNHQGESNDNKTVKTRGNAMGLGNLDNASKIEDQETRQEEPVAKVRCQGSEVHDASGVYAVRH